MGSIVFRGSEFVAMLSEMIGFKAGLALGAERLREILDDINPQLWPPGDDLEMRIRAEHFEELCVDILFRLGAGPPEVILPLWEMERTNEGNESTLAVLKALEPQLDAYMDHAIQLGFLSDRIGATQPAPDPEALISTSEEIHGPVGREIAEQFLQALHKYLSQSLSPCQAGRVERHPRLGRTLSIRASGEPTWRVLRSALR